MFRTLMNRLGGGAAGGAQKRLIIAGHSHADTLFNRLNLQKPTTPTLAKLEDDVEVYGLIGPMPRTEEYWSELVRHAPDSIVLILWGGNDHNAWFLFETTPRFDFVREDADFIDESAMLVPASLVEELFYTTPHAKRCVELLKTLMATPGCRPILLETPPPKGDDADLRQLLHVEYRQVAEQRGVPIETLPLTKREIRRKLWRSSVDAYARIASENGAEFYRQPDWVFDQDGFLKREHWQNDATHGSAEYGDLVRRHLARELLTS